MKVILLEKYRNIGSVGEVVEVKPGFARNYLIPNEIAVQATKQNIADFEARKADLVATSAKKEAEARKIATSVEKKMVACIKQAGEDGRLYGSVTNHEVSESLSALAKAEISRKSVIFNTPIKFIGIYSLDIDLGEGVFVKIYLNVARTEGEAANNEAKFFAGKLGLGAASEARIEKEEVIVAPKVEEVAEVTETLEEAAA